MQVQFNSDSSVMGTENVAERIEAGGFGIEDDFAHDRSIGLHGPTGKVRRGKGARFSVER